MNDKNIKTKEDFYRENFKANSEVNPHTIDNYKFSSIVAEFIKRAKLRESQINTYKRLKINLENALNNLNVDSKNKELKAIYNRAYDEVMQFETETGILAMGKQFCKEQARKYKFNMRIN